MSRTRVAGLREGCGSAPHSGRFGPDWTVREIGSTRTHTHALWVQHSAGVQTVQCVHGLPYCSSRMRMPLHPLAPQSLVRLQLRDRRLSDHRPSFQPRISAGNRLDGRHPAHRHPLRVPVGTSSFGDERVGLHRACSVVPGHVCEQFHERRLAPRPHREGRCRSKTPPPDVGLVRVSPNICRLGSSATFLERFR